VSITIGQYLQRKLKEKNLSQKEAAEILGVSRQTMNGYCKAGQLNTDIIEAIWRKLDIDLSDFQYPEILSLKEPGEVYGQVDSSAIAGVPIYDVEFSAGVVQKLVEARSDYSPIGWLDIPALRGCEAVIQARGNSMADRINDRDWIGIKRLANWRDFIPPGYIYAIITDELEIVKYIRKASREDALLIVSHNSEEYEPFELPKKYVREIWAVRAVIPFSKIQTII
jgi:transcriptional regulator with XRE-family HTH domain